MPFGKGPHLTDGYHEAEHARAKEQEQERTFSIRYAQAGKQINDLIRLCESLEREITALREALNAKPISEHNQFKSDIALAEADRIRNERTKT